MKIQRTKASLHMTALVLVLSATATLASMANEPGKIGEPVGQMTYPMWKDGCVLANASATGDKVTARIGEVIDTKHGKWKCAQVVADQASGKWAAAWVSAGK